jgi:hypothetical protein
MIETWLQKFIQYRIDKDVVGLVSLFANKFKFYENGTFEHGDTYDKDYLGRYFWRPLMEQESNLQIDAKVFAQQGDRYTVAVNSSYKWGDTPEKIFTTAIYLIELNDRALCKYFYRVEKIREW